MSLEVESAASFQTFMFLLSVDSVGRDVHCSEGRLRVAEQSKGTCLKAALII